LAGLGAFYVTERGREILVRRLLALPAVIVLGCLLLLFLQEFGADRLIQMSPRVVQGMFGQHTTLTFREVLNEQFLDNYFSDWGLANQLFGSPMGMTYDFYSIRMDMYFNVTPHNGYINFLSRTGAAGLIIVVFLLLRTIFKALKSGARNAGNRTVTPALQLSVAVTMLVYFNGYPLFVEHSLFLAIALGLVLGHHNEAAVSGNAVPVQSALAPAMRGRGQQPPALPRRLRARLD
jgi:O-antigen ligase